MSADPIKGFQEECKERVAGYAGTPLAEAAAQFMRESTVPKYSYNFTWLGRPIIQYPQDIVAIQELVWTIQPDLIVETGIAHGGSLILTASLLELNATCGGNTDARVLGIDIDIRPHNRIAIEEHPMSKRIDLVQGSSIDPAIVDEVARHVSEKKTVLVMLDSNHTHDHVLSELTAYAPFVTVGSYCVVFDTIIEDMPDYMYPDRPWRRGNNAKTALQAYLADHSEFAIDTEIDNKVLISVAPNGYLKRTR